MPRTPCAHLLTNVQYLRAVAVTFTPVLLAVASHLSRSSSPGTIVGKPSCTRLLWHQFSRQYTPGHRTVFSLKFTIGIFAGLCLVLFAGGSIFLSQSLALVQIRAVYSDSPPLSNYSNEERSLLMQGQGTADWCKNLSMRFVSSDIFYTIGFSNCVNAAHRMVMSLSTSTVQPSAQSTLPACHTLVLQ